MEKNSNWSITWLSTYSTGFTTLTSEQTRRNNSTNLSHWAPFIFLIHDDKIPFLPFSCFCEEAKCSEINWKNTFALGIQVSKKSTLYFKCAQKMSTTQTQNAETFFFLKHPLSRHFFSVDIFFQRKLTWIHHKKRTRHFFLYEFNWFYKFVILIIVFVAKIVLFNIRGLQNPCWKMQFFSVIRSYLIEN